LIRRFTVTACTLALVTLMGPAALAGQGGHKDPVPSTITLNQTNPYLGEWVDFTTDPGSAKNPLIVVNCYQNASLVWGQVGLVTDSFKLGGDSSPWLANGGGPASCHADLENLIWHGGNMQQWVWLAGTDFDVTG
jgi:hypothetical protein